MTNYDIAFQEMPINIVAFFIEIKDTKHYVINTYHDRHTQRLGFFACFFYHTSNIAVAKITLEDTNKKDFEPILYAEKRIKCFYKD